MNLNELQVYLIRSNLYFSMALVGRYNRLDTQEKKTGRSNKDPMYPAVRVLRGLCRPFRVVCAHTSLLLHITAVASLPQNSSAPSTVQSPFATYSSNLRRSVITSIPASPSHVTGSVQDRDVGGL